MQNNVNDESKRCGYIAILGKPNVGKSTLLNRILGKKISITTRKPQTTRNKILGVKTVGNSQMIYIDTPGISFADNDFGKRSLNRYMLKTSLNAIFEADLIVLLVDSLNWKEDDELILQKARKANVPIILAINKVDLIKQKGEILPYIETIKTKMDFASFIPLSAKHGTNIDGLENCIAGLLPQNDFLFPEGQISLCNEKFISQEIIREKLMRFLGEELPYSVNVEIEKFEQDERNMLNICALIWVEKESQKSIVIGADGQKLKEIGTNARLDLEKLLDCKVFLKLWVKVKSNWSCDDKLVESMVYKQ